MGSKKSLLSVDFGKFSKLAPERITDIRVAANALVRAYHAGDEKAWLSIIHHSNDVLTKQERGFFSAVALLLSEGTTDG